MKNSKVIAKNNSIVLSTAVLAVLAYGGMAYAQSVPTSKPDLAMPLLTAAEKEAGYSLRGSGPLGRNHPLPGTLPPAVISEKEVDIIGSNALCRDAALQFKTGKTANLVIANSDYHQALQLWSGNREALYGVAECAAALGDTATAIGEYRRAIYTSDPSCYGTVPGDGFQENDVTKLMQFAVVLNRARQVTEALFIYNRAASLLDYQDSQFNGGKPHLKVLLPELVTERTLPEQVRYTPDCLQALAETVLAHEEMSFGSNPEALAHMQEAVKLYPDSAVTNYYLGEALDATYYHGEAHLPEDLAGAKSAYQKAVQMGDDATVAAAKERLSMYR